MFLYNIYIYIYIVQFLSNETHINITLTNTIGYLITFAIKYLP